MINRGKTQSQYVYDSVEGILKKLDAIQNISEKASDNTKEYIVNSITIITAEDSLVHNYFHSYETSWDAANCLQMATVKMPKMGQENVNYWSTYTGELTVYIGTNIKQDEVNKMTNESENNIIKLLTMFSNDARIQPYFKGEVNRIKEYDNEIAIYVNGIGYRFQQKIPEEFRQKFIYNQNVRDAFQAMCEFLGIAYICPPQVVVDNQEEEQTEDETTTDGDENNVTRQTAAAQKVVSQARNIIKNKDKKKNNSNNSSNNSSNNNSSNNENETDMSEDTENSEAENPEISNFFNGYEDIKFDANGAIVHGSTVIEESPDLSETLINMEEHPLDRYLEDETGIIEKVKKFLNGEMFDELHNSVMDYGAVTITPATTTTTDMSTVNDVGNTNTSDLSEESSSSSNSSSSSSSSSNRNYSSRNNPTNTTQGKKGVWGKTSTGKQYLTQDYINSLSMAQAKQKYEYGKAHNIYTAATMQKLWYRMMFGTKFY